MWNELETNMNMPLVHVPMVVVSIVLHMHLVLVHSNHACSLTLFEARYASTVLAVYSLVSLDLTSLCQYCTVISKPIMSIMYYRVLSLVLQGHTLHNTSLMVCWSWRNKNQQGHAQRKRNSKELYIVSY